MRAFKIMALAGFTVLSACADAPYYAAQATADSAPLTLINDPIFKGLAAVKYYEGQTCKKGDQIIPTTADRHRETINLRPNVRHSFGVMSFISISMTGGYPVGFVHANECNSYFSFVPEPGKKYRYSVSKPGGVCHVEFDASDKDKEEWKPAEYQRLNLIIGKGCEPAS